MIIFGDMKLLCLWGGGGGEGRGISDKIGLNRGYFYVF